MSIPRLLWLRLVEWLYLHATQSSPLFPGTDPDHGGHMKVSWGWNDPTGRNRPLFVLRVQHTKTSRVWMSVLMSPFQVAQLAEYMRNALLDQEAKFGYPHWTKPGMPPDWDTRYMRVPEES